jgi:hypothetical protein
MTSRTPLGRRQWEARQEVKNRKSAKSSESLFCPFPRSVISYRYDFIA